MTSGVKARCDADRPTDVYGYALHGNYYLNLTNRCTLRCRFCPKFNGQWVVQDYALRIHSEPDVSELLACVGDPTRYQEVVFCGLGEPTLRLDQVKAVGAALREQGARVRLNTDGLANLVHGRDVTPELARAVDAISVSLNVQNAELYEQHCRPQLPDSYAAMLDFVQRARDRIPAVTVTALEGLEGVDIDACRQLAQQMGVGFRGRVLGRVG